MSHFLSFLSGVLPVLASLGLGAFCLPFFRARTDFIRAAAAGLVMGSLAVWAAGMAGLALGFAGWLIVLCGTALLFHPAARGLLRGLLAESGMLFRISRVGFLPAAFLGAAVLASLILSLVPPIELESVSADLVLPQQYGFAHKVFPMPHFIPSLMPFTARAGYLWCFLLGADWAGPAALNWAHAFLCCLLIARIGGLAGLSAAARTGAAAAWLAAPVVLGVSSSPLSHIQPVFYVLLAVLSFMESVGNFDRPGLFMAGLWAGAAAASRYGGWLVALVMAVGLLVRRYRTGRGFGIIAVPAVASIIPLLPVLAGNYLAAGSPFAPFFPRSEQSAKLADWFAGMYSFRKTLIGALVFPVQVVWDAARFSLNDPSQVGGLLLGLYLIPFALVWGKGRVAGSLFWPAAVGLVFYAAFFFLDWPLADTAVVLGVCALLWMKAAERAGKTGVTAVVAGLVLLSAVQYGHLAKRAAGFIRAGGSQDACLSAPAERFWAYLALKNIRESTPAGARLVAVFESRIYYAQRPCAPSLMQDKSILERVLEESETVDEVRKRVFQTGTTHLLVAEDIDLVYFDQYIRYMKDREVRLLAEFLGSRADLLYDDPAGHCKVVKLRE